jgi:hypothetical protein
MRRDSKGINTFGIEFLLELSREGKVREFGKGIANESRIAIFTVLHFDVEAAKESNLTPGEEMCKSWPRPSSYRLLCIPVRKWGAFVP